MDTFFIYEPLESFLLILNFQQNEERRKEEGEGGGECGGALSESP